ncbi:MAG: hypothetical protein KDA32_09200 [Phycisphaerales bacterium]|nr:hypothetical protein [Phycisphaerales bacterium]
MRFAVAVLLTVASATTGLASPDAWSDGARAALNAYSQEQWDLALKLAAQLNDESIDEDTRADALAINAMVIMRTADRKDRITARSTLANLAQGRPALLNRPEVLLAFGLAQQSLGENFTAVEYLDTAARVFVAERSPRAIEAFVALAELWRVFNEWEFLPTRFQTRLPADPSEAHQLRLTRIGAIIESARNAGIAQDGLARLELVDALTQTDDESTLAEGRGRLAIIAAANSSVSARASLDLGRQLSTSNADEAIAAFQRAIDLGEPPIVTQARSALAELTAPRLDITLPDQLRPETPFEIELVGRNVTSVEVEMREVQLGEWLAQRSPRSRKPRFDADALPTSGALAFQTRRDLDATANKEWRSADQAPIEAHAPAGAYVVIATGRMRDSTTITKKKIAIVSDLRAAVITGSKRATIVASRPDSGEPIVARFWAQTAIAAARRPLEDGAVTFALPPEFGRPDKRWVCLVESGPHMALLTGVIRAEAGRAQCVVTAAVPALTPFAGLTGGIALEADGRPASGEITIDWRDAGDKSRHAVTTTLHDGVFSAATALDQDDAEETFSLVATRNRATLIPIGDPASIRTPALAPSPFSSRLEAPRTRPTPEEAVLRLGADYPSGAPLVDAELSAGVRGLRFDPQGRVPPWMTVLSGLELETGAHGLANATLAEWALDVDAMLIDGSIPDPTSRSIPLRKELMWLDPPAAMWFEAAPAAVVGQPMRFEAGWYAPMGLDIHTADVRITRGADEVARLPMYRHTKSAFTPLWTPAAPGAYEAIATANASDGTIEARIAFQVDDNAESYVTKLSYEIQAGGKVTLAGKFNAPIAIIGAGADPIAATVIHPPSNASVIESRIPPFKSEQPLFLAVALEPDGPHPILVDRLNPTPPSSFDLDVTPAPDGDGATLTITGVQSGAALIRLVRVDDPGTIRWAPGPIPPVQSGTAGVELTTASASGESVTHTLAASTPLTDAVAEALFGGETGWVTTVSFDGNDQGRVDTKLPALPGRWRPYVVVSQTGTLRAARGEPYVGPAAIRVDAPLAAQRGDRFIVTAMLPDFGQPARVQVDTTGAVIESAFELRSGQTSKLSAPTDAGFGPVSGEARVLFVIEAARGDEAELRFAARAESDPTAAPLGRAEAHVDLNDPSKLTPRPDVTVHRELRLMRQTYVDAAELDALAAPGDTTRTLWQPELLPADARVEPGDVIVVRDRFDGPVDWDDLTWSQELPANCVTFRQRFPDLLMIGIRDAPTLQAERHHVRRLEAGEYIHEFAMLAVRPGVCAVPPPRIEVSGTTFTPVVQPPTSVAVPWPGGER